jgi:hypothetical protein
MSSRIQPALEALDEGILDWLSGLDLIPVRPGEGGQHSTGVDSSAQAQDDATSSMLALSFSNRFSIR